MEQQKVVVFLRERKLGAGQRGEDGEVLISVSDTGVGLPSGRVERIFDAFFTAKPYSTGMGLRICRSIMESHGGRLWAADNSPRGVLF